jgi:hypothetical protein
MSVVNETDLTLPVAAIRGKKVVSSVGTTASVLRRGDLFHTVGEAALALQSAGVPQLSEFSTQGGKSYGVILMQGATAVAVLMGAVQEEALVRRVHGGKVPPWRTLAAQTTPIPELGTHFVLSCGLALSILTPKKRARAESEELAETEASDNDELADEDGGAVYTMTVSAKTVRAFRLGLANASAAWGVV